MCTFDAVFRPLRTKQHISAQTLVSVCCWLVLICCTMKHGFSPAAAERRRQSSKPMPRLAVSVKYKIGMRRRRKCEKRTRKL